MVDRTPKKQNYKEMYMERCIVNEPLLIDCYMSLLLTFLKMCQRPRITLDTSRGDESLIALGKRKYFALVQVHPNFLASTGTGEAYLFFSINTIQIKMCYRRANFMTIIVINDLYGKPDIIRKIKSHRLRWTGHVARMGDERGIRRFLEGKPEAKRPVGRPRMKWENNTNYDMRFLENLSETMYRLYLFSGFPDDCDMALKTPDY
ncbi:hypothetical protein C0J52_11370 [Blattella germanica]|nr:hypothetical protein C0J52_11370 [Blattella germanica]